MEAEAQLPPNTTHKRANIHSHTNPNSLAIWSEWRDSNPRPLVPQTSALTGLRYTPTAPLIGSPAAAGNASPPYWLTSEANGSGQESARPHGFRRGFRARAPAPRPRGAARPGPTGPAARPAQAAIRIRSPRRRTRGKNPVPRPAQP